MKAFIDSSSLIKKYIAEKGSEDFDAFLKNVSEIIVSPIYFLEIHSVIQRRLQEKTLTPQQGAWLHAEVAKDYPYFSKVIWSEQLEHKAVGFIQKHSLKTLDAIQLASAALAKPDVFAASDKILFAIAQKELKKVQLI